MAAVCFYPSKSKTRHAQSLNSLNQLKLALAPVVSAQSTRHDRGIGLIFLVLRPKYSRTLLSLSFLPQPRTLTPDDGDGDDRGCGCGCGCGVGAPTLRVPGV